jgi:hypothetical protein
MTTAIGFAPKGYSVFEHFRHTDSPKIPIKRLFSSCEIPVLFVKPRLSFNCPITIPKGSLQAF